MKLIRFSADVLNFDICDLFARQIFKFKYTLERNKYLIHQGVSARSKRALLAMAFNKT